MIHVDRSAVLRACSLTVFFLFVGTFGAADASMVTGHIAAGAAIENAEPLSVVMDSWLCGKDGKIADPRLQISEERGLANVVVRLRPSAGIAAPAYPASTEPMLIDQKKCVFEPHVVVVAPGQPVLSRNSDATLHNFHTKAEANKAINKAQVKGNDVTTKFLEPEIVRVECDVHHWMSAVVVVADSAWTAVSDAAGAFSIDAVPAGSYEVALWHEQLGEKTGKLEVMETGGEFELTWDAAQLEDDETTEPAEPVSSSSSSSSCDCKATTPNS
jgi:plastocyanin